LGTSGFESLAQSMAPTTELMASIERLGSAMVSDTVLMATIERLGNAIVLPDTGLVAAMHCLGKAMVDTGLMASVENIARSIVPDVGVMTTLDTLAKMLSSWPRFDTLPGRARAHDERSKSVAEKRIVGRLLTDRVALAFWGLCAASGYGVALTAVRGDVTQTQLVLCGWLALLIAYYAAAIRRS